MTLYNQLLKHSEQNCDNRTISGLVLVIKKTKSEFACQDAKQKLFFMLGKLMVKAINNFNHLTRQVPKYKLLHTSEDIALECYVTYDICLKNLKLEHVKKFYFFLNTSLNRAIYRLFEKQYARHFNIVENKEETAHLLDNAGYHQHFDFSEIDLFDLNEMELEVLKFKVEGGKLNVFLKEHDITGIKFYETIAMLKKKLFVRYSEETYFRNFEMTEE